MQQLRLQRRKWQLQFYSDSGADCIFTICAVSGAGGSTERVADSVAICSPGTFANGDAGGSITDGFQLATVDTRRDIAMLKLIYRSFSDGGANCSSSICGGNASNGARDEDIKAHGTRANARADHAGANDRASDAGSDDTSEVTRANRSIDARASDRTNDARADDTRAYEREDASANDRADDARASARADDARASALRFWNAPLPRDALKLSKR